MDSHKRTHIPHMKCLTNTFRQLDRFQKQLDGDLYEIPQWAKDLIPTLDYELMAMKMHYLAIQRQDLKHLNDANSFET